MAETKKLRFGVLGFGNMGAQHVKYFQKDGRVPRGEVVAVCDIDETVLNRAKNMYPDLKHYLNPDDLINDPDVDVVVVAVPHYEHPPLAIKALEAGKHVIIEKPAGVYGKQVLEMIECAKKHPDQKFGIMYNQRTNPLYQKVKHLIESGQLGGLKRITWVITNWYRPQAYHDSATWRSAWATEGGGTLINQNPHQIDLWQWMFGMPDKITAFCEFGKYYDIEVEDEVVAYMKYNNGLTGVYITSTGEWPGTNRLEIACDMGNLIVEESGKITFRRSEISEREHNANNTSSFARPPLWECEIPVKGECEHHVGIFKNFIEAVQDGKELLAPGEDGLKGLTMSNAMHYSTWTGKQADLNNFPHDEFYELLQEKIKNSTSKKKVVKKDVVEDMSSTF